MSYSWDGQKRILSGGHTVSFFLHPGIPRRNTATMVLFSCSDDASETFTSSAPEEALKKSLWLEGQIRLPFPATTRESPDEGSNPAQMEERRINFTHQLAGSNTLIATRRSS